MTRLRLTVSVSGLVLLLVIAGSSVVGSSPGGGPHPAYVPGDVLVKFHPNARALDKASARAQLNALKIHSFRSGAEHWKIGPGQSVEQAVDRLKKNPHVEYAEPNYLLSTSVIPNDPRLNEMYGLINTGQSGGTADADIDAELAWGVTIGSSNVIVGVIDTGCDYNHPDLAANIWTNPGEIAGNGIDDDGNGYIDDVHGYDFFNNDSDPFDDNGHGSHTSGTIGAVGNNGAGVVGVNWNVKIMCLKFLSGAGSGSTAGAIAAVDYSVMMGVDLTSNSWGGGGFSQALYDSIAAAGAAEEAFVAAAGNSGVNTDTSPQYPSAYDLANIISVAATDRNDALASFSNYGAVTVDLGAPGVDILSTLPGNSYGLLSGTSMATPHVAGVAALVRAVAPNIPVAQLKAAIMTHTDAKASLAGRCVTGGRLNAFFAIATPDADAPSAVNDLATNNPGSNTMGLSWTAPAEDGSTNTGTTTFYQVRYSTSPIDANNFSLATRAGNEPNPMAPGTSQSMEVQGLVASTYYYFAIEAFDEWGNAGPISNIATDSTLPPPTAGWTPASITENLLTGETADDTVTLTNTGVGRLDFTIPTPSVGEPFAAPQEPLILGKDEPDPRQGDPVTLGAGGPDPFGYRWVDSDEAGGPTFSWTDISSTGTPIAVTGDDATSAPVALSFNFPFYGTFFNSIRACTNGFLSLSDTSTAYLNQPLPNSGAPANLIAPFWDDLNPGATQRIFFQDFGNRAIVQWNAVPPYSGTGAYTFQAILEQGGVITYQYLSMSGAVNSATVGIQNAAKTTGLQVAFNQTYIHDNLAVRISAIPQWLTVSPTSGRLGPNDSILLHVHLDAAGLEGGHYPGQIDILSNDPVTPSGLVDVLLHVVGAPDAAVQPAALAYGTVFQGLPNNQTLTVANIGTDTLIVSGIGSSHPGELAPTPSSFSVPPHGSQNVTVTWTPAVLGPFSGALTVNSNAAGNPMIVVPVTGNAVAPPVVVTNPNSFEETLFSNQTLTLPLVVTNAGGSNLILTAAADQGPGGNGLVVSDPTLLGNGGPDAFGYRWRDSDASGGPTFAYEDISVTGTPITLTGDDVMSSAVSMGMTFPLYGNNFTSFKVCTNGFITFNPTTTSCPFTNGTLFSTSLPTNSIPMFWDDLVFRTAAGSTPRTSRAFFKNDGTKVIVQYKNVYRIGNSTTDDLNFEVLLYPSGKIVLQYLSMTTATLNSETIGIQGLASPNFLQVIANAAYMHNNLAIQISKVPDWLTVTPAGATIPPGGSQTFSVKFDSTSRVGGTLTGAIRLGTNIPAQPTVNVPAILHVIGVPTAAVVPTSFNYGTVYTGYSHITSFQVLNNGTDVLNISNVDTTDSSLVVEEPPGSGGAPLAAFPLAPGASRLFSLRWSPMPPGGPLSANVRINSDDPVHPILLMPITGNAIQPPVAYWTPPSFTENLMVGDVVNETLHVENHGLSNLTFSTAVRALGTTPPDVYDELKLDKDEIDPRPGILGSGGPDLAGYRWKDSDAPGGPTFAWTDISGIGTPIASLTGDDQNSGAIPIGFAFPFYGTSFTDVRVVTNGWLSFTSTATSFTNQALPNSGSGVPENLIAAFWDDLDFRSAQHAYYYNDGTRFIVQWNHVDHHSAVGSADLTFQAILHPNGRIVLQYLTMTGLTNSATIGFQNSTRNDGQTVVFNAAYVHNSLAIQISPPLDFIQVSPSSGTIPPSGTPVDLNVRIDTSNLIGGDYAASVDLITNDPANGLISVPVYLHVTGIPDINVTPLSLTFPTTFVGFGASLPATITNVGTDVLHIGSASIAGDFTLTGLTPPVSLPVNGAIPVIVTFAPTTSGTRNGTLTIGSDDPDENPVVVTLQGEGLFPPIVGVAPSSISTALPPGGSRTKTETICNTGGSDLNWTGGREFIDSMQTPVPAPNLAKGEEDPTVGTLGSGGPDGFGYRWKDSDNPAGPAFSWVDISTTGTPIAFSSLDDAVSAAIPMGMSFPYYGSNYTGIKVSTNGWLTFNTAYSGSSQLTNGDLPSTSLPGASIAMWWDDLYHRTSSDVKYLYDGTRFILQFTDVNHYPSSSTEHYTFQVQLYPSGKVLLQYQTMTGLLNSATIGVQDSTQTIALKVVFNAAYVHSTLAIGIERFPEWMMLSPTGGTIPAGGCQDVTVTLNAAGLDDGVHHGTIEIASNDPYTPLVTVPVTLNVGLVATSYLNFDPDVLNLSSNGNTVKMVIELPQGLDPHAIGVGSVLLNDTVPALTSPISYGDENQNGVMEISLKFSRPAVEAILPEGASVQVCVQGEVADVQWWRGCTSVRAIRPQVQSPVAGSYFVQSEVVPIRWTAPAWGGSLQYDVQLSRDGGMTWEVLAAGLPGTAFDWIAAGTGTPLARIRVLAFDGHGLLGYDNNDGAFTVSGSNLQPPYPVDGSTMDVDYDGTQFAIQWKMPPADVTHGPADRFRVLSGTDPRGPLPELAVVTGTSFSDGSHLPSAGSAVFYRIVAANAGGDAR